MSEVRSMLLARGRPPVRIRNLLIRAAHRLPPRTNAMPVILDEIDTLDKAYETGELAASSKQPLFAPDDALNKRISLFRGDITKLEVDAIVNAANRSLLGGGGVDGAIHRAAGGELVKECRTLDGCSTGKAKITKGYKLPSKHVIHAVGPIYDDDEEERCEKQLKGCYDTSLALAVEHKLASIAFSGISTGIYGYPLDDATHVALRTTRDFLTSERGASISRVIFTVFRQIDVDSYKKILPLYFPPAAAVAEPPAQEEEKPAQAEENNTDAVAPAEVPQTDVAT